MRSRVLLLGLALVSWAGPRRSAAQQVTNPSFEADPADNYRYMTPTGWRASGGVIVVPSGSAPWGGLQTPDGDFYASVQGSGSFLEQTVTGECVTALLVLPQCPLL